MSIITLQQLKLYKIKLSNMTINELKIELKKQEQSEHDANLVMSLVVSVNCSHRISAIKRELKLRNN